MNDASPPSDAAHPRSHGDVKTRRRRAVLRVSLACLVAYLLGAVAEGYARAEEPSAASAPPAGFVSATGARGFGFTSADGSDSLYIHWLVDADSTALFGTVPQGVSRDTFTMGFAGLQLDATLAKYFRSSVLVDFSQSRLTLLDAFVEARFSPQVGLRVGKFSTPLNEERLTPLILLPWISTGPGSILIPVRELGVQLLGTLGDGVLQYNVALVNGSWAGTVSDNDPDSEKDGMARVYVHPFLATKIAAVEQLGLGLGASYGEHEGTLATPETAVLRSYGGATFSAYPSTGAAATTAIANGPVSRLTPEITYAWGRFAAYANYTHEVDRVSSASVASDAFGATAAVALSGENAEPFARIRVSRPWNLACRHYGGVLLVAGGGIVAVGENAFLSSATPASMRRANILGAGINWYLVDGFGVLADFSETWFDAYGAGPSRPNEHALHTRLEFHM